MVSPASRHRLKAEAETLKQSSTLVLGTPTGGSRQRNNQKATDNKSLMSVRLHEDIRQLSTIRSRQRKNQKKRELIACYIDYLMSVITNGRLVDKPSHDGRSNLVLTTVCIWCFDAREYSRGLPLFEYIVEMNIRSPDSFKSTMCEIVSRTLADHIIKHNKTLSSEFKGVVGSVLALTEGLDMADAVRANLYRAYAMVNQIHAPDVALNYYKRALSLSPEMGVKRVIKRLEKIGD